MLDKLEKAIEGVRAMIADGRVLVDSFDLPEKPDGNKPKAADIEWQEALLQQPTNSWLIH